MNGCSRNKQIVGIESLLSGIYFAWSFPIVTEFIQSVWLKTPEVACIAEDLSGCFCSVQKKISATDTKNIGEKNLSGRLYTV